MIPGDNLWFYYDWLCPGRQSPGRATVKKYPSELVRGGSGQRLNVASSPTTKNNITITL